MSNNIGKLSQQPFGYQHCRIENNNNIVAVVIHTEVKQWEGSEIKYDFFVGS